MMRMRMTTKCSASSLISKMNVSWMKKRKKMMKTHGVFAGDAPIPGWSWLKV